MKNTYFVLAFLMLILWSCAPLKQSSKIKYEPNLLYKELSSFGDDTLEYVKQNFYENQQYYVGKPAHTLFRDLETDIITYTIPSLFNPMDKSDGVHLTIRYNKNLESQHKAITSTQTVVKLIVKFEERYVYDDALKLYDRNAKIKWGKAQEDFYKDFTIKEIFLYVPEIEPIE